MDAFDSTWAIDCYPGDTLFQHLPPSLRSMVRIMNLLHQYPEYQQFKAMITRKFMDISYKVKIDAGTRSYLQSIINAVAKATKNKNCPVKSSLFMMSMIYNDNPQKE